jgi:hypothetical protein
LPKTTSLSKATINVAKHKNSYKIIRICKKPREQIKTMARKKLKYHSLVLEACIVLTALSYTLIYATLKRR